MDINKVFYPNEECIKYVKEAVLEIEIVAKYTTRKFQNISFYQKHGFYLTNEKIFEEGTTEYLIKLKR